MRRNYYIYTIYTMIDWTPELININIKIFWTLSFLGYWPLGKLLAASPSGPAHPWCATASPNRNGTANASDKAVPKSYLFLVLSAADCPRTRLLGITNIQPPINMTPEHFSSAHCDTYPLHIPSLNICFNLNKDYIKSDVYNHQLREGRLLLI